MRAINRARARAGGPRPENLPDAVALVGLVAAGVLTRFVGLSEWSIWGDEIYTWLAGSMPLPDMWRWTAADLHPPLYYAAIHWWMKAFGDSEAALRAPSAIASTMTAIVLYVAVRPACGRLIACLASLVLILNPAFLFFSREARMYPLTSLLALLSAVAWARYIERPAFAAWGAFVASLVALIYTDYSGFFVAAGLSLATAWFVVRERASPQQRMRAGGMVLALGVAAIAYVPWWPHALDHARRGATTEHIAAPGWSSTAHVIHDALGLERADVLWIPLAVFFIAGGMYGVARRRSSPVVIGIGVLAAVPLTQLVFSVVGNPVFDLKRVSAFIPGLALMTALALVDGTKWFAARWNLDERSWAGAAAALAALTLTVLLVGVVGHHRAGGVEDWRTPARTVRTDVPVFAWRTYVAEHLRYYARSAQFHYLDRAAVLASRAGYVVFPRDSMRPVQFFFVPVNDGEETASILAAAAPYFDESGRRSFPYQEQSVTLTPKWTSAYNVVLGTEWGRTAAGYLDARGAAGFAMLVAPDGVAAIDVEVVGTDEPYIVSETTGARLAVLRDTASGDGRAVRFEVPAGLTGRLTLFAGAVSRLEFTRLNTSDQIAVVRDETALGRLVFLRADGFLQSVTGSVCLAGLGERGEITLAYEYLDAGEWRSGNVVSPDHVSGLRCVDVPAGRQIRAITVAE